MIEDDAGMPEVTEAWQQAFLAGIVVEMKDFHGRLCSIEERRLNGKKEGT